MDGSGICRFASQYSECTKKTPCFTFLLKNWEADFLTRSATMDYRRQAVRADTDRTKAVKAATSLLMIFG